MSRITVALLDAVLSPATTVQYWKDDKRQHRAVISPDAAVIAVEHDQVFIKGKLTPCITVYVGEDVEQPEDAREPEAYKKAVKQLKYLKQMYNATPDVLAACDVAISAIKEVERGKRYE